PRHRHERGVGRLRRVSRIAAFAGAAIVPATDGGAAELSLGLAVAKVRTGGLAAIEAVAASLRIDAAHVVFGHVHRAGPLPGETWRTATGTALHNPGGWLSSKFVRDARSPYRPGRCLELVDGAAPRLVQ